MRQRSRPDRGAIHPMVAIGFIILTLGGVAWIWSEVKTANGPNPAGYDITTVSSSAHRDTDDRPVVKIN